MDVQKLRMIRDAAGDVESQIVADLERLIGRPIEPSEELEALDQLQVSAEDALKFAIANSMKLAVLAVAVRHMAEELLSDGGSVVALSNR